MLPDDKHGSGTYETISKALFDEYQELKKDPHEYSKKLGSDQAK